MDTNILQTQINELRTALPILEEKAKLGAIHFDSAVKAKDLLRWFDAGRTMSEKQILFVGRLLQRAKRKHRNLDVKVNVTGSVDTAEIVRQAVAEIEARGGLNDGDLEKIERIVTANVMVEIENRKPRQVEILVKQADTGKTKKVAGAVHKMFEHLVRMASIRLPNGYTNGMFIAGEASSGKTTGCKMLAEALGLKWHFNGAISFPHEMLGFIDGAGKYHRTPFREAYEHGGVYTFDEVDRSDPVALLAVNPHTANGVATFPDKQIKRHKDCIIICTANTWGLGADANYSGATKLDAAFLSRFPIKLSWDIDPVLEEAIVTNSEWLDRVRKARGNARSAGLKVMIDTRAAMAGQSLIEAGYNMDDAAGFTYLANLKPEQRKQVEA
jgi:cobaltochelatase CobS